MAIFQMFFTYFIMISAIMLPAFGDLSPDFYDEVCPEALPTIKHMVEQAISLEPRMGASLVRLHFHDCFVNGCDGSILLDDTPTLTGEKMAGPNNNSVRGFDVIDQIKAAVNEACLGNVVSCADILAVAARDSVVSLGGSCYNVLVGRRDATTASMDAANANIPSPLLDLPDLISSFESHGLGVEDLVVLSGAHTLGFSRCVVFRNRIYNDNTCIDGDFAAALQVVCPSSGEDNNLAPLDESPASFDTAYYQGLVESRGLLHSDQQLFKGDGSLTDELVHKYSENPDAFWADFGKAMIKMGNMNPLTGSDGEIRGNCRFVNGDY